MPSSCQASIPQGKPTGRPASSTAQPIQGLATGPHRIVSRLTLKAPRIPELQVSGPHPMSNGMVRFRLHDTSDKHATARMVVVSHDQDQGLYSVGVFLPGLKGGYRSKLLRQLNVQSSADLDPLRLATLAYLEDRSPAEPGLAGIVDYPESLLGGKATRQSSERPRLH